MENTPCQAIIQTKGIAKHVSSPEGTLQILQDINIRIQSGSSNAILGASGSGKSTLLGLLAGLDTPSQGQILFAGQDIGALDEDGRARLRAGRIGFVFQSFQLLPGLTALENVMLPLELSGKTEPEQRARTILDQVGLQQRLRHYPSRLSGGEQQRVAIARAFAVEPELLLADEPTGNLDQTTGAKIIDLLFSLNQSNNTTLVMVTHDQYLAQRCQQMYHLDGGRLVESNQDA